MNKPKKIQGIKKGQPFRKIAGLIIYFPALQQTWFWPLLLQFRYTVERYGKMAFTVWREFKVRGYERIFLDNFTNFVRPEKLAFFSGFYFQNVTFLHDVNR